MFLIQKDKYLSINSGRNYQIEWLASDKAAEVVILDSMIGCSECLRFRSKSPQIPDNSKCLSLVINNLSLTYAILILAEVFLDKYYLPFLLQIFSFGNVSFDLSIWSPEHVLNSMTPETWNLNCPWRWLISPHMATNPVFVQGHITLQILNWVAGNMSSAPADGQVYQVSLQSVKKLWM